MRDALKPILEATLSLARHLDRPRAKKIPTSMTGNQWTGTTFVDLYQRQRNPTPNELLAELKGVAWACISLNAAVCANYPPRLYVTTDRRQPPAKCPTRPLRPDAEARLRARKDLPAYLTRAAHIEEVLEHPLLTLLRQVNPIHNAFDLWELTHTYLEVHGRAFWYLEFGPFGVPDQIWVLPAQNVNPRRRSDSANVVDYYEYRTGGKMQLFRPEQVIFFRYPDPRDPYLGGLSPLRAAFEQITLASSYAATKSAIYDNQAIPSALITPDEVLGEEERDRLETQWNAKFRRGGSGKVLVAESGLRVQLLQHSMGDLAALADMAATKEDICNAFHCPIAFFTTQTNLANLQAADSQHLSKCIHPRLTRRDEKLNEQLLPLFDPAGRLFLASEDPTPVDQDLTIKQQENDLKYGVVSINEVRSERGLPPVPWGNVPWLPDRWLPTDQQRTTESSDSQSEDTGS
jgi:HK97 family phage portal protein